MKKYLITAGILSILEISLAMYLIHWREIFWNYVESRNFYGFMSQIGVFTLVALLFCAASSISQYLQTLSAIYWRFNLNVKALEFKDSKAENVNQRIQEDCASYPDLFINLVFGLGKSLLYILLFSVYLIYLGHPYWLIILYSYAIISTLIAHKIANPLIKLNYSMQKAEATYRNKLSLFNFMECIIIAKQLAKSTKNLNYFQTFYAQIGVVIPIIIASPMYFFTDIKLGALMQATGLMGTINDNLSYGITSYNILNKYRSCSRRLKEIGVL